MIEEFITEEQLYNRIRPALNTKRVELVKLGLKEVTNENIWSYLKEVVWSSSVDLTLSDIVNDILHLEKSELLKFINYGATEDLF